MAYDLWNYLDLTRNHAVFQLINNCIFSDVIKINDKLI